MIHVLATITTNAGRRDALIAAFKKLRPLVLAEAGCIQYDTAVDTRDRLPSQDPSRDNVLMVIEKWESVPYLEAHLAAPHMQAFREACTDIVTNVAIHMLEPTE